MKLRSTLPFAFTALAAGASGWLLATAVPPDAPAPVRATQAARTPLPAAADAIRPPLVLLSSDGNVTLHVEQQPLAWVIEQIVAQGGWVEQPVRPAALAASSAAAIATGNDTACVLPPAPPRPDAGRVLQTVARGSDAERSEALLQAREASVVLPDDLLKASFETGSADTVRLLAFEAYLERRQGDARATRAALEAALYLPGAALQAEARERLAALDEAERGAAALVQAPEGVP
jgi:hypothetical protein